jgi:hypothetical protein
MNNRLAFAARASFGADYTQLRGGPSICSSITLRLAGPLWIDRHPG